MARCRGGEISIRYTVRQPGQDSIDEINVAGVSLNEAALDRIRQIVGRKSIDGISIVHCDDDESDPMSVRLLLDFGRVSARDEGSAEYVGIILEEGAVRVIGER